MGAHLHPHWSVTLLITYTHWDKYFKVSYDVPKKNIILCTWCNAMLMWFKVQKTLFSTYCTLLLLLYAPPFWNESIFRKLIILRSEVCTDWPAIQCLVIGRIPQAWDGNVMPFTILWCRADHVSEAEWRSAQYCALWVCTPQLLTAKANAPLMFRSRSPVNQIPHRSRSDIKFLQ